MFSKYDFIKDFNPIREDWRIKVRVIRCWKVPNFHRKDFDDNLNMILMDEQICLPNKEETKNCFNGILCNSRKESCNDSFPSNGTAKSLVEDLSQNSASPIITIFESLPSNGVANPSLEKSFAIFCLTCWPRQAVVDHLKANLTRAQSRMKHQADKHRQDRQFKMGDRVLVRLQPYRQMSVARRANHKLAKRYFGPFTVEKVINAVAYQLILPASSMIHPVFHVSLLKPFYGTIEVRFEPLPEVSRNNRPVQHPIALLASRHLQVRGRPRLQYLVQWSVPEDATWEDANMLRRVYPTLNLEDKVAVEERTDDRDKELPVVEGRRARIKSCPSWAIEYVQ